MGFSEREIGIISNLLIKYIDIAERPDELNNIILEDNVLSIKQNGEVFWSVRLSLDDINSQIANTDFTFGSNVFLHADTAYSPLEADRSMYSKYWGSKYSGINFPKFISVMLFSILQTGKLPSFLDFHKIYSSTYTELLTSSDIMRASCFSDEHFREVKNGNDRLRLGMPLCFTDGTIIENKLLRFKPEIYTNFVSGLPFNEFTTEYLLCREYKVYSSLIRDIHSALLVSKKGYDAKYNLWDDLCGVDLYISGIPIYSFVNSKSSLEFRKAKVELRHPNLKGLGVVLMTSSSVSKKVGIQVMTPSVAEKVIACVNEIKNGRNEVLEVVIKDDEEC